MAPRWEAKMQARSHSIAELKTLAPPPSGPSRFAAGTRHPLTATSPIGEVRSPILDTADPRVSPGVSRSTRKAVTPAKRRAGSTVAKRSTTSATGPLVTKVLAPSRT